MNDLDKEISRLEKNIDKRMREQDEAISILKQIRSSLMDMAKIKKEVYSPKGYLIGYEDDWDFDRLNVRENTWLLSINNYLEKIT